jgi:parallel beta-helix repeat protein
MQRVILLLATMAKLRTSAVAAMSMFAGATMALAVLGLMVLGGDRALAASQVRCGETITTDTTLHSDLLNCPNHGIVIGADGITLNLNGHLIDGDGTPAAGCDPQTEVCDVGVLNKGHDGVTVRGGSVRQFNVGVWAGFAPSLGVSHNRLLGISSSGNYYFDILLIRGTRSLIRNCSVSDSGNGAMLLIFSHYVRVLHNSFRHSGYRVAKPEAGFGVFDSTDNLIEHNSFSGNKNSAIDMRGADRNRVIHNSSVRDGNGIVISEHSNRNVIARNHIAHATEEHPHHGDGIAIEHNSGDHNIIEGNLVVGTTGDGIGVGYDDGVGNVVRRNHILGAGRNGIHVASVFTKEPTSSNVVYRNYILGAGEDGVHVDTKAKHTDLVRNHAIGAKDDGLDADDATTKLTGNQARHNADLGIEAVRGVIDGGENKASGNGDPRQCTNIFCN